jgi:hypothetical protein
MATVIKIKSSLDTGTPASNDLAVSEQAYSFDSDKLFIGKTINDDVEPIVIGGKHFTDMLIHTAGTTTAGSALIVDTDDRINLLSIGSAGTHLDFANATITADGSGTDVSLTLNAKGSGSIDVSSKKITSVASPTVDTDAATKGYVDTATSSLSASLTISDGTTSDVVTVGTDTLTFDGGTGIDATVSDNQVSFAIDSTVATLTGAETLTNKTLTTPVISEISNTGTLTLPTSTGTVALTSDIPTNNNELTNGAAYITGYTVTTTDVTDQEANLTILTSQLSGTVTNVQLTNDSVTVGTTEIDLGASATTLAGLTQVDIDNVRIMDNSILTTDTDGDLILSPNGQGVVKLPSSYETRTNLDADSLVPKSYVDAIAEGLHVHASVKAATTGTLTSLISDGTVTYANGTSGVGATLTLANALGTLDDYTLVDGDRILIKDESAQEHNGIYIRTDSTTFTRASDFDTVDEIASGDFLFVENGTINGSNGFVQTETHTAIGGANDDIIFEQFSGAGQIEAGSALTKSGNTLNVAVDGSSIEIASDALQVSAGGITNTMLAGSIDLTAKVTATLPVTNGGTGLATVTSNGVVLGNGDSALAVTAASTADGSILQADSAGTPAFSNIIDGGSF